MSEMQNFIHSLARAKWRDVTPDWKCLEVAEGTQDWAFVEPVEYDLFTGDGAISPIAPAFNAVNIKLERFAGWDYHEQLRNVFIGYAVAAEILFYWVEPLKGVIEWGGYQWAWPEHYGGLHIYHWNRKGMITGYSSDLRNWLVRWEDNGDYSICSEDYIRSAMYHR